MLHLDSLENSYQRRPLPNHRQLYTHKSFASFSMINAFSPTDITESHNFRLPRLGHKFACLRTKKRCESFIKPSYDGPYPVISRTKKTPTVEVHGRHDIIAKNRLKPEYLPANIAVWSLPFDNPQKVYKFLSCS